MAFAGIIYTIVIQREELRLQRKELQLQRQEVAKSTAELAGQKEMMYLQRFETTFFNPISAHNEIVASVVAGDMAGKTVLDHYDNYFIQEKNTEEYLLPNCQKVKSI
ncbi:hypothetical protein ACFPPD_02145 [Cohnella suwonensis]|uniref:Uncharacterized protein n=1 Tax=Cohnella suwonensis TaxID=696072 RepID=A0ABW0LQA2_9BACL